MSYPVLPNNRVIVNGVDLSERFKMVLGDGYTLTPPSPKSYVIDIPGGNGKIDLTDSLLGDIAYNNRTQEFTFYVIDVDNFEKVKTEVSNFLHGKAFDYRMTMDPGYTYHGRFTLTETAHSMYNQGKVGVLKISVDANPFKYKDNKVIAISAVGGATINLESGRLPVVPAIITDGTVKVIYDGKLETYTNGSFVLDNVRLKEGNNAVYFNTHNVHNLTWKQLKNNNITWGNFGKKPLYEWYKTGFDTSSVSSPETYITYKWGDL